MGEIFGVGIDQIKIPRVLKACQKDTFLEKYYSERERELFQKRHSRTATNFVGKEAVVKAFGTGFSEGISPRDVQILRRDNGAPYVELTGEALRWAQDRQISKIHISLTDTEEYAGAFVVAEREVSNEDQWADII